MKLKNILIILIISTLLFTNLISVINAEPLLNNNIISEENFDEKIELMMKFAHMPSLSTAIIENNSIVWYKGYGYYDIKNQKTPTEDTIYMAASITKTITSVAVMQLYEQGLLDIDEDINNYLDFSLRNPKYPDEKITIRNLLSHSSSLNKFNILTLFITQKTFGSKYSKQWWLREHFVPGGTFYRNTIWSKKMPNETYIYSNMGYNVLEVLVEIASGKNFEEYCRENIFEPLCMFNTSFYLDITKEEDYIIPYIWQGIYVALPHYDLAMKAAGGSRTTVEDLSHFLIQPIDLLSKVTLHLRILK